MSNSTITLMSVVTLCSTHMDLMPLANVGGASNEPALSLCNDAISEIITLDKDWKWNRNEMAMLVTTPNKQDYAFAGASAFTLGSNSSGAAIGLASNSAITETSTTVTVTTLEAHRFTVGQTVYMTGNALAAYNSTFTDDGSASTWSGGWVITAVPSTTSFQFTHASSGLAASGAPGITNFGWLSAASMVEMNSNSSPQNIRHIKAVRDIVPWSKVADPDKVCVVKDNGDGTLKVRFCYTPGTTIWGANLVYQARAPLKVALTDTWFPIPDQNSSMFRQALIYRMYRYINSPRTEVEYQKFQAEMGRMLGADNAEEENVYLVPEDSLVDLPTYWSGF